MEIPANFAPGLRGSISAKLVKFCNLEGEPFRNVLSPLIWVQPHSVKDAVILGVVLAPENDE